LMFREGKKQRTISPTKTVFAEVQLDEDIPSSFGIYDLNNLLAVLTFDGGQTPAVSYSDSNLVVKIRDNETTKFRCCEEKMLVTPPNKDLDLGTPDIEFDLSEETLSRIMKAASILSAPHIVVEGDGSVLSLTAIDTTNDSSNQYSVEVAKTDQVCRMVFRTENWKMMLGSYHVSISSKGIAKFENSSRHLKYWLALEVGSKTQK
jgi:hypothetical protein